MSNLILTNTEAVVSQETKNTTNIKGDKMRPTYLNDVTLKDLQSRYKKSTINKKIMKKRNVITLKNNMEEINYINSHCSTNVRKPNKRHLVRGHWRHYNHKYIWIKPHYRGVNNGEYLGKVFKCCG